MKTNVFNFVFCEDRIIHEDEFEPFVYEMLQTNIPFLFVTDVPGFNIYLNKFSKNQVVTVWVHHQANHLKTDKFGRYLGEKIGAELIDSYPNLKFKYITRAPNHPAKSDDKKKTPIILLNDIYQEIKDPNNFQRISDFLPNDQGLELEKNPLGENKNLDFAVITALYDSEITTFLDNMQFDDASNLDLKNGKIGKHAIINPNVDYSNSFMIVNQNKMGVIDAASFATRIVTKYPPKFLLMGGVCGGRKKKGVSLYDIIIPTRIFDYMTGKLEKGEFISYGHSSSTNENLTTYIERNTVLIKANMLILANHSMKELVENVKIHIGDFACGPWVVKTDNFLEKELATEEKKNILGLEMESLSILRTSENFQKYGNYALVVKSVMDFTDDKKSDGPNKMIKSNAAYISYLCIRSLMPLLMKFEDSNLSN